jgi:MFS family permease
LKNTIADQIKFVAGLTYCLATSFLYYVTFVQFALLHHFEDNLKLGNAQIFQFFGIIAAFGILGSIGTGFLIDRFEPKIRELLAFIGAFSIFAFGLSFLSIEAKSTLVISITLATLGLTLGALIVLLLHTFNRFCHLRIRGAFAGLATAVAYLAANLIAGYANDPALIANIDGFAIGSNVIVLALIWDNASGARFQPGAPVSVSRSHFVLALVPLLFLVFLDTYCFYPVGQASFGPNAVFGEPGHWVSNGVWHCLLALCGGLVAFSLGTRRLLIIAYASLILLASLLIVNHFFSIRSFIFPVYSLLVVCYAIVLFTVWGRLLPAKKGALRLGIGLAVCGWIGSGVGIGTSIFMENILPFPLFFVPVILLAPAGFWLLRKKDIFYDYADEARTDIETDESISS